MSTPSAWEAGAALGSSISGAVRQSQDTSALDQILTQSFKTGKPEDYDNAVRQILSKVSRERQPVAMQLLDNKKNQILAQQQKEQAIKAFKSRGLDPSVASLDPSVQKEFLKSSADEALWKDVIARRTGSENVPPGQATTPQAQPSAGTTQIPSASPPGTTQTQPVQEEKAPEGINPKYASNNVDPRLFKKDISKYETTRLAEGNKGYQRNQNYLKTVEEQAGSQRAIQDSIRQAITDVQSGNTSGALATIRQRLAKTFPSVLSAEEKNFSIAMKNVALEEFASTPGFRSQGEFFILQQVLPNLGDKKLAQELTLKAILDGSLMKSKEEEIVLDIINNSPDNEVPLNLKDIVNERMNQEWKKLYARRYAENPQIWDQYIKSNPNDPLFKDIQNVPVPSSAIDWKKYTRMINPQGKQEAIPNSQVQDKLTQGYKAK